MITFNVESYKLTLEKLNNYEIEFDGEPIDDDFGKVKKFNIELACIRTPDGLMIGIYESKDSEADEDNFNPDIHAESKMDSASLEIKNILDKFKI